MTRFGKILPLCAKIIFFGNFVRVYLVFVKNCYQLWLICFNWAFFHGCKLTNNENYKSNLATLENIGTSHRPQIYSLYKPHLIPNFVCDDPDFLENIVKLRLERVDIFRRRNRDRTSDPWMSCFGHRTIETSPELIFHAAVMFYAQNVKCYLGCVC